MLFTVVFDPWYDLADEARRDLEACKSRYGIAQRVRIGSRNGELPMGSGVPLALTAPNSTPSDADSSPR